MSEQFPTAVPDEPAGDLADQASRLQMAEEQEAIRAALAGDVHASDEYEDRPAAIDVLEGPDVTEGDSVDASDDPVYGGGMPVTDPDEAALDEPDDAAGDLAMTGLDEAGAAMAVDEGATVVDEGAGPPFEQDGDPDYAEGVPDRVGEGSAAEDEDALIDVLDLGHDLDDPQNPDGYGVPPAPDGGSAAFDLAELRDPVDDKGDYGRDAIDPAL